MPGSLATRYIPQYVKGATVASNFFAGAINVISLTPAGQSRLGGVVLSMRTFTAAAVITFIVYKMVNGVEEQILSFTRIAGTDPNGTIILDSPDIIDGNGALNTWRVTAQSSAAGDNARAMAYEYSLERIG